MSNLIYKIKNNMNIINKLEDEVIEILKFNNKYTDELKEFFLCLVIDWYSANNIVSYTLTDEIKNEILFYITNESLNELTDSIRIQKYDEE